MSQMLIGVAGLVRSAAVRDALIWSQAIQASMSYTVAGLAKLAGPDWRSEKALLGVLRTHTYGSPVVWRQASRCPRIVRIVSMGMLAFECLFPFAYLPIAWVPRLFIGVAVAFHGLNAGVMGLGRFLPSFMSLHPAVLYTSAANTHRPSRLFPLLAAGAFTAAVGVITCQRIAADARLRKRDRSRKTLGLEDGRQLVLDRPGDAGRGVVVLVGGLGTQMDEFDSLKGALAAIDIMAVTYRRPVGRAAPTGLLDAHARDLVRLVDAIRSESSEPVVLLGYSLGAEIVRRAIDDVSNSVHGVLALDPSHPGEFVRSDRKAATVPSITESLRIFRMATAARLGALLDAPPWIQSIAEEHRRNALDEYRSARTWRSVWVEWNAARLTLVDESPPRPSVVPVRVVAAGRTVAGDPMQAIMYNELARTTATDERPVAVIPGVGHDDVLQEDRAVRVVVDVIVDLLFKGSSGARREAS
ncbi:alpha/beta fold hydrolase [Curtobacterium sp. MMLR14_010]|uniref:alpha/beta fold hydrolase n=1 Tax=Curtobacterium sp. MMLR14_010 TaxID=1898743 RepID=UPI001587547C|nr:alpha/beta fold hydrolase [Curtobacterium sp. MMLR14_010]